MKPITKPPFHAKDRPRAKPSTNKTDANTTTTDIINFLNQNGCMARRINTHGIYDTQKQCFRKLHGQSKGTSDIIGMQKGSGRLIAIEIKIGNDSLSPEQHGFLNDVEEGGGIAMITKSFDDFLKRWEYRKANGKI
jgi:hypothetical protein